MKNYILMLEDYCDDCPEFDVNVRTEEYFSDTYYEPPVRHIEQTITCKHRKRCANMVDWIKKNDKKEKKENVS